MITADDVRLLKKFLGNNCDIFFLKTNTDQKTNYQQIFLIDDLSIYQIEENRTQKMKNEEEKIKIIK